MNRFVNHIMPQVPECPQALIKAEVLRAGIRFCKDSWIWQQDEEKTVTAGNDEITFSIPTGSALAGVQLSIDGYAVNAYTRSGLTVTLDDAVGSDTTYQTTCFLKPARDATALPNILYDDWFEGVESLAKSNLMMMPDKKWYQPQLAKINYSKYLQDLGDAKIQARKVNDQSNLMIQQRSW